MEGGFQNMSDEDRAKMKERGTEFQKVMASIQQDVDRLRFQQIARDHTAEMTALKEAMASAEKEKAKDTAAKLNQLIAERQKAYEERGAALGYTPEQMERMGQMGQRRGGGQ
jgi:isocitrate lyase